MNNSKICNAIFFVSILLLASCINLQKVNDYSSNSTKSIKKFEELGYSFTKACYDKCQIEQLEKSQLRRKDCDCKDERDADSVTLAIYNATKGYFEGITKLSDNELTNYKFDALTKALKEGSFGDLKINKGHVDAYSKVSRILTRAISNGYRKKKLSTYIGDANDAIKILLDVLELSLVSNLSKRLDTKKQRLEGYYFDLSNDPSVFAFEKKKLIEEYSTALEEIEIKKKQIIAFGNGLQTIAKGHQILFEHRNKMDAKDIKVLLTQYSSNIQDIVDEFNKIKNQD